MPRPLPDELLEEVLLRLPPENPAGLVRAGLVCARWCRVISDPGFRRRFREFHRRPPMLGMLRNNGIEQAQFIPTTAFCTPHTEFVDMRVLDARHGRVLCEKGGNILAVWDPITDEVREFPFPQEKKFPWTAAVLCSAAGACGHLDCHDGPFLVVFVGFKKYGNGNSGIYTYSSDAAAWSERAICTEQPVLVNSRMGSALVGNALYFGNDHLGSTALKYDLKLHQTSLIRLPSALPWWNSVLTTTEDCGLGIATVYDSKLYMWSRKDTHELNASWESRVSIELKTLFPVDGVSSEVYVIGSTDGLGIIFMRVDDAVYTIDLQTFKAKEVCHGRSNTAFPYMSFYTPALKGTCTGEGPTAGHSSTS